MNNVFPLNNPHQQIIKQITNQSSQSPVMPSITTVTEDHHSIGFIRQAIGDAKIFGYLCALRNIINVCRSNSNNIHKQLSGWILIICLLLQILSVIICNSRLFIDNWSWDQQYLYIMVPYQNSNAAHKTTLQNIQKYLNKSPFIKRSQKLDSQKTLSTTTYIDANIKKDSITNFILTPSILEIELSSSYTKPKLVKDVRNKISNYLENYKGCKLISQQITHNEFKKLFNTIWRLSMPLVIILISILFWIVWKLTCSINKGQNNIIALFKQFGLSKKKLTTIMMSYVSGELLQQWIYSVFLTPLILWGWRLSLPEMIEPLLRWGSYATAILLCNGILLIAMSITIVYFYVKHSYAKSN